MSDMLSGIYGDKLELERTSPRPGYGSALLNKATGKTPGAFDNALGVDSMTTGGSNVAAEATGAASNQAKAGVIGAGIQAGAQLIGGAIGEKDAKEEREKQYKRSLDSLFEQQRREQERQRVAEVQKRNQSMMNRLGYELSIYQRKMQDELKKANRIVKNVDKIKQVSQHTNAMKDQTRALGSMGGM